MGRYRNKHYGGRKGNVRNQRRRWKRRHFKPRFRNKSYTSNQPCYENKPVEVRQESKKPSFLSKMKLRYKILLGVILLNIIVFLLIFIFRSGVALMVFSLLFIPEVIVIIIVWLWGWTNSCPRCHSHWARKLVDRSHFGTHTEYENVKRNMTHTDAQGNVIGSSSYNETRPVSVSTIQNHWVCRYCGNTWSGRIHDVRS